MREGETAQIQSHGQPGKHERPWLFAFLIAPMAVLSNGVIGGALSYLLRGQGIDPAREASVIALLSLPPTIYFLWSPLTDFWMRRRTWLMVAAVAGALAMLSAFHQSSLATTPAVTLMFLSACFGQLIVASCGGMMGTLRSEANRRRAGSFYQCGNLAFGAAAVFTLVLLAGRHSYKSLGPIAATMIVLPALAALATPAQAVASERTARETAVRIWREFKATFLHWQAVPYIFLMLFPTASGAMIGLLPGLATDYGVNGSEVAWINGLGGVLLTAAGAFSASLIPIRVRAPIAFLLSGLVNAATLAVLWLGPQRPAIYLAGTVFFLFTVGAGYALFTGVVLEFLGDSGKSGSSRYAIINSLGNWPGAYMSWIDGWGYARWGPRAMPGVDAVVSTVLVSLLLAYFIVSGRRKSSQQRSEAGQALMS